MSREKEANMLKTKLTFLVLFLIFTTSAIYAAPPEHCSLATLKGSYGFFGEAPATLAGNPITQLVVSGIIRFDGNGNLSGESLANVGGSGGTPVGGFVGTYTVSPDCTYSGVHTGEGVETLHFVGTITGSGMMQEMRFVVTDPGWVALGTVRKIQPCRCSLATLKGSYALFGQGTVTYLSPPAPIAHVGIVTYDGAGHLFGSDTIMLNGAMVPDTFTGSYTVTAECRVSVEINSTAVGLVHELGWIVGAGESHEVRLIGTDPGLMFVEATRKQ